MLNQIRETNSESKNSEFSPLKLRKMHKAGTNEDPEIIHTATKDGRSGG